MKCVGLSTTPTPGVGAGLVKVLLMLHRSAHPPAGLAEQALIGSG